MASIKERKKNPKRVNEGFGIISVTVDFNMARLIAIKMLSDNIKESIKDCKDKESIKDCKDMAQVPVELVNDVVTILDYIAGDTPNPFGDSLWNDEQPEGLD